MPRLRLFVPIILASCTGVRPMQRPTQSVRVTAVRAAAALPDDCEVRIVDGHCALRDDPSRRANFEVVCKSAPPASAVVAHARVCTWSAAEMEELRHRACAAEGDTLVLNYSVSDSCTLETFDRLQGTSEASYTIYRTR
ncbi:MAG TPA: hypothetical protein VH054_09705 [Polyangiaceae bacterium]|nr:hypothetical protein [Polyangiaceae bacterium]